MFEALDKITRIAENAQKLNKEAIFLRVFKDDNVMAFIISLNTVDQIFQQAQQSDGSDIKGYKNKGTYTEGTIGTFKLDSYSVTRIKGLDDSGMPITETVTENISTGDPYLLYETGTLFNSFDVQFSGDSFTIGSVEKRGKVDIVQTFGEIRGLTDESTDKLIQEVIPLVINEVKRILFS